MTEHPYDRIDGPSRTDIAREDWLREHPEACPVCGSLDVDRGAVTNICQDCGHEWESDDPDVRPDPGSDVTECQWCGEGPLVYLGQLGHLSHWRCRACGSTQHIPLDALDAEVREAIEAEDP